MLQVDNACVSSHGNLVPFGIFIRFRFSPQFALPFYFLHSRFDVGLWNVTRERVAENRVYTGAIRLWHLWRARRRGKAQAPRHEASAPIRAGKASDDVKRIKCVSSPVIQALAINLFALANRVPLVQRENIVRGFGGSVVKVTSVKILLFFAAKPRRPFWRSPVPKNGKLGGFSTRNVPIQPKNGKPDGLRSCIL